MTGKISEVYNLSTVYAMIAIHLSQLIGMLERQPNVLKIYLAKSIDEGNLMSCE